MAKRDNNDTDTATTPQFFSFYALYLCESSYAPGSTDRTLGNCYSYFSSPCPLSPLSSSHPN